MRCVLSLVRGRDLYCPGLAYETAAWGIPESLEPLPCSQVMDELSFGDPAAHLSPLSPNQFVELMNLARDT